MRPPTDFGGRDRPGAHRDIPEVETIERRQGTGGELALRRRGGHLEIVSDGVFLISTENEVSSRALVRAARPLLPARPLDVLIGGLGVGHALDEALDLPGLRSLTVVEIEPVVVDWFKRYGGLPASRAAIDARVNVHVGDVGEVVAAAGPDYDLAAFDTDNGPEWLVREANARLYGPAGLQRARAVLRPGGVAAFWTMGASASFAAALGRVFADVAAVEAIDVVGGRPHTYVVYVGRVPVR